MITWTESRDQAIKDYALDGKSAQWIAEALDIPGITRNCVVGRANRIGVKLKGNAGKPVGIRARPRARPVPAPQPRIAEPKPVHVAPPKPPQAIPPQSNPMDIFSLRDTHCRFPLWSDDDHRLGVEEKMYCGTVTESGEAYCASHKSQCEAVPRTR